jgi:hypothetical protein
MPQLQGFSHVSLSVRDRDRSAQFYGEVFGFEAFERPAEEHFDEIIMLHRPTGMVLCLQQHHTTGESPPTRPGPALTTSPSASPAARTTGPVGWPPSAFDNPRSPTAATVPCCACATPTSSSSSCSGARTTHETVVQTRFPELLGVPAADQLGGMAGSPAPNRRPLSLTRSGAGTPALPQLDESTVRVGHRSAPHGCGPSGR